MNAQSSVAPEVRAICEAPSGKRSSYFETKGKAEIDGNIRVKLVGVLGTGGEIVLTKQEWEGVQRVLRKDQVADNQSYRECAKELTPILIRAKDDRIVKDTIAQYPTYPELVGHVLESIPRHKFTYELVDGCTPIGPAFAEIRINAKTTEKKCEITLQSNIKTIEYDDIFRTPLTVSMKNLVLVRSCKTGRYVLELHGPVVNHRNRDHDGYFGIKFEREDSRDRAYAAISALVKHCSKTQ